MEKDLKLIRQINNSPAMKSKFAKCKPLSQIHVPLVSGSQL
jgi:hypothetical protein